MSEVVGIKGVTSVSETALPIGSMSSRRVLSYRAILFAVVAVAAVAGFVATGQDSSRRAVEAAGPELAHLLRMMAGLKVLLALGAVALIDWRLRLPVGPRIASAYLVGAGLVAVGPGLLWGMSHVILGAVLLHGGFALLLALGCTDGGVRSRWSRSRGSRA